MSRSDDTDPVTDAPSTPRRAVLAAGVSAAVAALAAALGRPGPADAADGQAMILGSADNTSGNTTKVTVATNSFSAFWAVETGISGTGVRGTGSGEGSQGVLGESPMGTGVQGTSSSGFGVAGYSGTGYGVYASSSSPTFAAIRADQLNGGPAVEGSSTVGVGVHGNSSSSIGVSGTSSSWIGVSGASGKTYGVYGEAHGTGSGAVGVLGTSISGIGMLGKSRAADQAGAIGWSGANATGVIGVSNDNSADPPAPIAKTGVFGQATQDSSSRGVFGVSTSGQGVRGEVTSGSAVYGLAKSISGYAVRGSGRVRFDKVSGVATIPAGATSVTVTPGTDVTSESFVLLTAKANLSTRSLYFTTDATNNRFTIRISSSRTSSTPVAWLLLN